MSRDAASAFEKLVDIVSALRAPDGCPWDRDQTSASLLPFFLEEVYEVIESVDAEENGFFKLDQSLNHVSEKLVRRHPHVFGDAKADAAFEAKQNWEATKHKEKNR